MPTGRGKGDSKSTAVFSFSGSASYSAFKETIFCTLYAELIQSTHAEAGGVIIFIL